MFSSSTDERSSRCRRWRLRSYVLDRGEFNAIRMRLPRAVRRDVDAAPEGHVGLVAQAIVGEEGDLPLMALYGSAPPDVAAERVRGLERRIAELLG